MRSEDGKLGTRRSRSSSVTNTGSEDAPVSPDTFQMPANPNASPSPSIPFSPGGAGAERKGADSMTNEGPVPLRGFNEV